MTTLMEQLTQEVSKYVISQITSKLLPAISEKYNIPIEKLMEIVNNGIQQEGEKPQPTEIIKALPKKSAQNNTKELNNLQQKIQSAQAQGKVLNVESCRPLADSPSNRKKYKFFDELGIAGLAGSPKLKSALELFGAPPKREIPVHEQALKAKKRANLTNSDDSEKLPIEAEEESVSEVQVVENSEEKVVEIAEESEEKQVEIAEESKEKEKVVEIAEESEEKQVEIPENSEENVDAIVKLSSLIEDNQEESEKEEEAVEKAKPLIARYNPKIKEWWNPETCFLLKRKGAKSMVFGKYENNSINQLTQADLKMCKNNGWDVNLDILSPPKITGSESDDDDS